jgi:hypothetical protein
MSFIKTILSLLATGATSNEAESNNSIFSCNSGLDKAYEEETITHGIYTGEKTVSYKIATGEYGNPPDIE